MYTKSLDDSYKLIAALLHDVHNIHGDVFNTRNLKLTLQKVDKRLRKEGMGFLTKTLPRLGKAFDKSLSGGPKLNAADLSLDARENSQLPRFLGELFSMVLHPDGSVLPKPCIQCVKEIRQVLYLFYKYELPYTDEQEQQTLSKFERTEEELTTVEESIQAEKSDLSSISYRYRTCTPGYPGAVPKEVIIRRARILLNEVFAFFDPTDVNPRHGPGAVATKQQLWGKYQWTNVSRRIAEKYPLDAYFYASIGHFSDRLDHINEIGEEDLPARVVLVPKDSRGPRIISCEPVDFQWVQGGLNKAIVALVESHPLTKWNVNFTRQEPNQRGALLGSKGNLASSIVGRYSTLDLNEASDRVSLALVRLLFPEPLLGYLEACRSLSTVLPDGRELKLKKFAPMGSSLCFPVLALTIWAILTAAAPDADTKDGILVYGDDVVVPTAYAENAMNSLESFGLKINRDKSCTGGFFRESCGVDAFMGENVTPVRLRTVWSSRQTAGTYCSWISYANSCYDRSYYCIYNQIVEWLGSVYGPIPEDGQVPSLGPDLSLRCVPENLRIRRYRIEPNLQKRQWLVWDVRNPKLLKRMDGWLMLLRYFTESGAADRNMHLERGSEVWKPLEATAPFTASQYTKRGTSMLVKRWR
jgi:hypothetical protein